MTPEELQLKIDTMQHGDRFANDNAEYSRDPRTGRYNHPNNDDTSAIVEFKTEAIYSPRETALAEDGLKKFINVDFISVRLPGERGKEVTAWSEVTDFYINRFPHEHEAFKAGKKYVPTGTPLSLWPAMTPASIKELEQLGITTVEQLANLNDSNAATMRGFYGLKNTAQAFLKQAKDVSATALMEAKMKEQEVAHQAQLDAMNAKLEALLATSSGNTDLASALKTKRKVAESDK